MDVSGNDDGQFSISPRSDVSEFNESMSVAKKEFVKSFETEEEALRFASDSAAYNRYLADRPLDFPNEEWKDEPDLMLRRHKELVYLSQKQSIECERMRRHMVVLNDQNKMMSTQINLLENSIISLSMRNDYALNKINEEMIDLKKQLKDIHKRDVKTSD